MAPSYWDSLDMPKNVSTPSVGTPQTPVSTSSSYWDNLDANVPVVRAPKIDTTSPASLGGGLSQSFTTGLGMMTGRLLDQILHASAQTIRGYEGLTDAQLGVIEKGFEKFGFGTKKLKELRETDFTGKLEQYREKLKRNIEVGADVSRETNPFASTFAGQTAEVLGGLVPQVGMALAGAPQVGLALSESVMNVEDSYDENIKKGMSKEDALKRAIPQLGADLAATYITNKLGTFSKLSGATNSMFKSRIAETLKDSSLEIAQEVWQQGLQNLATDKPFTQDMSETAKLTILPALLFGTVGNIRPTTTIQEKEELKQKVSDAITTITQKVEAGEKLTQEEEAVSAITNGTDPFIDEKQLPQGVPTTPTIQEATKVAEEKIQQQPVEEVERGVSKIAKSIESKAVESGITKGFTDIAGYDKITIEDQTQRATTLIESDIDLARAVVRGEKELPTGLKGAMLIKKMEDYLIQNPDSEIAYELANSPLITGTSEAAQELRIAAERDPDSATSKIQQIKKAREEKAGKVKSERGKKTAKKLVEATKEVNLSKSDLEWDSFLNSITC